ncbi:ATP-dependent helicase [Methanosarcina mazei]|uniref:ATP-dependent helicase n=1 Tax=Methanosarcina mazei TaxID=2209 RepID=A0A0F8RUA8_METMZ|nr:ATP-dependent helicase [Methanosarcina mazei]KKG27614.1 ATP-dependent helicase [Methanosarcina mazei]KKG36626.1 ATP-dependent helicase [Methanosarcina mazei]KKH34856.1 ATP-dependent helicase [Methanosarcina mazei]KKH39148.1 ATP-dependent helicase [Methanosarcina mazei]
MIKHNLSPSLIAKFFYHNCERYLRFHSTPLQMHSKVGIPVVTQNHSPVTKALIEAGNKWEETVILNKLKNNVIIPSGEGALHERSHPIETSLEIFSKLKTGDAVYQPTILVSPKFYQKYHLSPEICRFSACRPDLVRVIEKEQGETCLQAIDVKASEELSSSHRIQATLYALMMKDVLEKNNIDAQVDLNQAGIWLNGKDEPELFNLNFNIKIIKEFLHYRLPEILQSPLENVQWHVYSRCELCDFYHCCRKEAEESNSVSLVPYLSVSGRKYLREAEWDHQTSINSLLELEAFLDKQGSDDILNNCGSLRNKGDSLRNILKALKEKEVIINKGTSLSLPKNEDVSIFITLQKDPVSGQIYTAGFRRFKGKTVYGDAVNERIYVAESPEKCTEIQRSFLQDLLKELRLLHEYNENLEWKEQKSLQTYVYDGYELDLLKELFRESVKIIELAPAALDLLFYFQDSSLFNEKRHPLSKTSFPIVVLTSEIQKLVSLPIPFSLRLPEVVEALPSSGLDFKINPSSLFWFEHSNALKSDAISMAWESNRVEALDWIKKELSVRLLATSSVLDSLRAKVGDSLVSWPPKFQIPAYKKYNYPEVSQMIFITRYESYMRNMEIREKRSLPFDGRVKEGISVPIQYLEQNLWKVTVNVDSRLFEQNENISYLLVPEGKAGEKAQITFDDYKYRTNLRNPSQTNVCFAIINKKIENEKTGKLMGFFLEVSYNEGQLPFKTGDRAILHPRFTDFSSERIINRLTELDEQLEHDFIRLLRDPHKFAVPIKESNAFSEATQKCAVESGFTESQKRAFEHMINNRLTLIWGPPGTGKTYFLARAILNFVKAKMEQEEKIHVAVTAFTHSAIENLLIKIQELSHELKFGSGIEIYKLKELKTGKGQELLKVQSEYEIQDRLDSRFLILGGTVNSFNKINRKMNPFDILIVDEASQMKPAELALGMSILGEGKRLVLAGDDLQLPPIISGDYPETEDGLPGLYDSIFSYLRNRDDTENPKYTCQLLENWRMNETLSSFSSHTLYGEGYKPAIEEVSKQKLKLLPSNSESLPEAKQEEGEEDLVNWTLDPAYPLIVIILENTQATIENEIEAEMVAKLAVHLRQNLSQDDAGNIYPDNETGDSDFWKSGLFIVSPHRAQIRTIQIHLNRLRKWHTRPFVDTVDKTQGQEAEAVIVSYGVSDTDTAMNEAEFIYSLNRLNVSVTRAKSKCVVFLPRPLLEPPLEILQNKKASEGLNHMLNLVEFCKRDGEERKFEIERDNYGKKLKLSGIRSKIFVK